MSLLETRRGSWMPTAAGVRSLDLVIFVQFAVTLAFRCFAIPRYRIETDELQHLHLVWSWTQGLVQFRDVYDNHLPLFHLANAPWLAMLGERADVVVYARVVMVPVALLTTALVYVLSMRLFGPAIGVWSAFTASLMPVTFLRSLEFRNDTFAMIFCLAALCLAISELTPRRSFFIGLLLGASLAASIKTLALLGALGLALLLVDRGRKRHLIRQVLPAVAGLAIVPLLVAAFFAWHGALDELIRYGVLNNATLPVPLPRRLVSLSAASIAMIASVLWAARWGRQVRREVAVATIVVVLFGGLVCGISPRLTERDFLIAYPVAVAFLTAAVLKHVRPKYYVLAPLLMLLTYGHVRGRDANLEYHRGLVGEVLRLTRTHEPLLDLKGETVYRRRPTYLALEQVSRYRIEHGIVPDTMAADVVRERCYVATRDATFFPPATRAFLNRHFISVGRLRVAGQRIAPDGRFTIAVPGPYAILGDRNRVVERRWYDAGTHAATVPAAEFVIWGPAVDRGFAPIR